MDAHPLTEAETLGVPPGKSHRLWGQVRAPHACGGHGGRNREPDIARAAAHVNDEWRRCRPLQRGDRASSEQFRLLTRHENIRREFKFNSHETVKPAHLAAFEVIMVRILTLH